jgi:hypothetical protein
VNALPPVSDPGRLMPVGAGARADAVAAAVVTLRGEQRRLERLGFEQPLARCHHRLRYWEFVAAMVALPASPGAASRSWSAAPPR